jgi:hypothetical protein
LKESDLIDSLREIQWLDFLVNFNLNSSRPNIPIITPYGVTNPKKMMPSTMGLTIIPSKSPNRIHNLFNGIRTWGIVTVINKNNTASIAKACAHKIESMKRK